MKEVFSGLESILKGLSPRANRIVRILFTATAMLFISFAIYLQKKPGIGLSPWNALSEGLSKTIPFITFGMASAGTGLLIILADIMLHEKIGVGTFLDAIVIGAGTDLFDAIDILPELNSYFTKIPVFLLGLAFLCFGQFLYMYNGLSCGPRDSLLVALGKRFPKITIGTINNIIFAIVLIVSWFLGATIGIGTVIAVFGNGKIMDIVFSLVSFEPRKVKHEDVITTLKVLLTDKNPE